MKINLPTAVHCGVLFHGESCLTEALVEKCRKIGLCNILYVLGATETISKQITSRIILKRIPLQTHIVGALRDNRTIE